MCTIKRNISHKIREIAVGVPSTSTGVMMKDKALTSQKKAEWERLLMLNQIYMGDHLTRQWSKSDKDRHLGKEDGLKKNNNVTGSKSVQSLENKHSAPDSQPTLIQPSRSQYSVRKIANGKRKLKSAKEILMHRNIAKEDMQEWQESFDSLLNSPAGRYVFKLFLESEIADENLKFWLACEDLKNTKSKRVKHRVQDIYDTFIDVYSPHEINIDYKMREDIVEQLKYKKDVTVFTEAQHQIYTLMHRDSYPRFLSSPFAAELIKALDEKDEKENKSGHKPKTETVTKSSGIIACCYCSRQDSEHDIDELVEHVPGTAPTLPNNPPAPSSNQNQLTSEGDPRSSKTDSIMPVNASPLSSPSNYPDKTGSSSPLVHEDVIQHSASTEEACTSGVGSTTFKQSDPNRIENNTSDEESVEGNKEVEEASDEK